MKKEINKRKEWEIVPFKSIRIGDPSYFEEMAMGSSNKYLKTLTIDTKTRCCKNGAMRIDFVHFTDDDGFEWDSIEMEVFLAKDEHQLEVYQSGRWYGEETIKSQHELGCDTAQFEMEVDEIYDLFHTGADGYYGNAIKYKEYYGFYLSLSFDPDLFSFEEVEERMTRIFKIKGGK